MVLEFLDGVENQISGVGMFTGCVLLKVSDRVSLQHIPTECTMDQSTTEDPAANGSSVRVCRT